ncbi:MAG: alpha/beta fold hydrolase [Desulfuromonadaceae bacterium]|nr:alpha/beta fold hydrolase [Desulfuromonadaceae bacterium]MDD5104482.1 alpha/beta fold hydrolase [Desulfuromonadaceae bacterium]
MNYSAYLATGQMIALMEKFSRIKIKTHGQESIPSGSIIFVVNHFTRIETLLLPYHIYTQTHVPVWSLADHSFFEGPLSGFLKKVGAVSTRNPERDRLIVKTLLTGETNWIIFPEGHMVKDKEATTRPSIFSLHRGRQRLAHTGAANLALRTEFYRKRLNYLLTENQVEAERLMNMFQIENMMPILTETTSIVPVNLTYYPLRARENVLSTLADRFARNISDRLREELLTEGTMFFDGVDIDLRFGTAIPVAEYLTSSRIRHDIYSLRQINFDDQLPSLSAMRQKSSDLTQRFMADIYSMTTVNHDHLFASLLRALPFDKIAEDDFRRRVFLLTDMVPDQTLVFCHRSLLIGQVALLTDDRYHKYRDFLELAQETGVIRQLHGSLLKSGVNVSKGSDFHRVRVENPLGVAANEVKPLAALKRKVRLMAWLPEILVRHQVADVLQRQVTEQFETDYTQYYLPDVSKERSVGAPFLLKGTSRQLGILLLHGFLAAPSEMRLLAEYLHGKGYWVYSARLRGHGTSPEDLATRNGDDWIESVDGGYAMLSAICSRVIVGGFSFGGGLALECAARVPGVAGVFAVSPPFRLQDRSSRFAPAVSRWNRIAESIHCPGATKEFVANTSEHPQINYERVPIAALSQLESFMKNLEARLSEVTVPTLIVQASDDPVVHAEETALQFERIGAGQKQYATVDARRHGILNGQGSEHVHALIADFISGGIASGHFGRQSITLQS